MAVLGQGLGQILHHDAALRERLPRPGIGNRDGRTVPHRPIRERQGRQQRLGRTQGVHQGFLAGGRRQGFHGPERHGGVAIVHRPGQGLMKVLRPGRRRINQGLGVLWAEIPRQRHARTLGLEESRQP